MPLPGNRRPLETFLRERLLVRFDVVITYDLGNGIRVEKGGDRFAEWPPAAKEATLPKVPREAIIVLTHYLRFCANVARIKPEKATRVAVIVRNAGLIVPPSNGGANYELSAIASQLREWAADSTIAEQHCATFLLTENLNDLHPLVARNPQAACIQLPLPQQADLLPALEPSEHALSGSAQTLRGKLRRTRRRARRGHPQLHRDPAADPPAPRQGTHAEGPRGAEKRPR